MEEKFSITYRDEGGSYVSFDERAKQRERCAGNSSASRKQAFEGVSRQTPQIPDNRNSKILQVYPDSRLVKSAILAESLDSFSQGTWCHPLDELQPAAWQANPAKAINYFEQFAHQLHSARRPTLFSFLCPGSYHPLCPACPSIRTYVRPYHTHTHTHEYARESTSPVHIATTYTQKTQRHRAYTYGCERWQQYVKRASVCTGHSTKVQSDFL